MKRTPILEIGTTIPFPTNFSFGSVHEWIEIAFPMDRFVATWRGRVFPKETLDPTKVAGMGFLLGDKKPGPFKLEVEWIRAAKSPHRESGMERAKGSVDR